MTLRSWPDNILTKTCKNVEKFDDSLENLLFEMRNTMEEEKGLGIAAPQVGESLRVFLLKTRDDVVEIINPVIISTEGKQYEDEGCLSFKGIYVKIVRPTDIHFKYQDKTGEQKEGLVYGKEAICFAHEFDHLSGVTILNHVNRQERKRILKYLGV